MYLYRNDAFMGPRVSKYKHDHRRQPGVCQQPESQSDPARVASPSLDLNDPRGSGVAEANARWSTGDASELAVKKLKSRQAKANHGQTSMD